jgi:hypothetical protein
MSGIASDEPDFWRIRLDLDSYGLSSADRLLLSDVNPMLRTFVRGLSLACPENECFSLALWGDEVTTGDGWLTSQLARVEGWGLKVEVLLRAKAIRPVQVSDTELALPLAGSKWEGYRARLLYGIHRRLSPPFDPDSDWDDLSSNWTFRCAAYKVLESFYTTRRSAEFFRPPAINTADIERVFSSWVRDTEASRFRFSFTGASSEDEPASPRESDVEIDPIISLWMRLAEVVAALNGRPIPQGIMQLPAWPDITGGFWDAFVRQLSRLPDTFPISNTRVAPVAEDLATLLHEWLNYMGWELRDDVAEPESGTLALSATIPTCAMCEREAVTYSEPQSQGADWGVQTS